MKKSKLFWLQLALMLCSLLPQLYVLSRGRTKGLTVSFFLINLCFFLINARVAREEKNREALILYSMWASGCALGLLVALAAGLSWYPSDVIASGSCILFACMLMGYRSLRGMPTLDPVTKGTISGFLAVVLHAQVIHAMAVENSNEGFSISMLLVAHVMIVMRMVQFRASKALLISETVRLASIITTSAFWFSYL